MERPEKDRKYTQKRNARKMDSVKIGLRGLRGRLWDRDDAHERPWDRKNRQDTIT